MTTARTARSSRHGPTPPTTNGGINGHKVKVIALDDQGNPTVALQDAQQLVQQDHVLAVVDDNSNGGTSYGTYLQQQGVPLIGATSNPPAPTDDLFFPVGGAPCPWRGGRSGGQDRRTPPRSPSSTAPRRRCCAQAVPADQVGRRRRNGATVSYVSAAAESAPSYTPYCLAAKQSGAHRRHDRPGVAGRHRHRPGLRPAGLPPARSWSVGPRRADLRRTRRPCTAPWPSRGPSRGPQDNTPATKAFHTAIKKYEPSIFTSNTYNATTANSWADAQMFAAGAAKMTGRLPAALVDGPGLAEQRDPRRPDRPETFTPASRPTPDCYTFLKLEAGKWVALNNGAFHCPPAATS